MRIGTVLGAVAVGAALWAPHARAQSASITVEPEPEQRVYMGLGIPKTITVSRPFKTLHIIDPTVIDAVAESDTRATLVPKTIGITAVSIIDENGNNIASLIAIVNEAGTSRVKIYNKKLITSYTVYRCGPDGCQYVDELQAKEPAPLPRGYSNTTDNIPGNNPGVSVPQFRSPPNNN